MPGPPGGGSSKSPQTPGQQSPGTPSVPQGGGESSSESQSDSQQQGGKPSAGSEGPAAEDSTALPPDWEEESDASDGAEGEPSFEDVEGDGFEAPTFEESEGMSQQELEQLEKELEEALGDFDEDMEREQTYTSERANDNSADGNLGGIGAFENYQEGDSDAGDTGKASASSESSSSESAKTNQSQQAEGGGGESAESSSDRKGDTDGISGEGQEEIIDHEPDVPSGHDDDIVARQIREAAENEADPELRKRLWEEYRNYKSQ